MTQKYAVIGDPVAHSLSPAMHNAAFQEIGWDAVYKKQQVPLDELETFADFARLELAGFNITVPHKRNIIPFLDHVSKEAALAESVNTVSVRNGQLFGDTTDGFGMENAIFESFSIGVRSGWFVFIGCGGAAHAAALHFAMKGAQYLGFINRTQEKAQALADKIKQEFPSVETEVCGLDDPEQTAQMLGKAQVAIQCTPLGLKPDDPPPVPAELLPQGLFCYDTIYKETAFLKAARAKGLRCAGGLNMLLYQGAKSFEIWTTLPAPLEVMRAALEKECP